MLNFKKNKKKENCNIKQQMNKKTHPPTLEQ